VKMQSGPRTVIENKGKLFPFFSGEPTRASNAPSNQNSLDKNVEESKAVGEDSVLKKLLEMEEKPFYHKTGIKVLEKMPLLLESNEVGHEEVSEGTLQIHFLPERSAGEWKDDERSEFEGSESGASDGETNHSVESESQSVDSEDEGGYWWSPVWAGGPWTGGPGVDSEEPGKTVTGESHRNNEGETAEGSVDCTFVSQKGESVKVSMDCTVPSPRGESIEVSVDCTVPSQSVELVRQRSSASTVISEWFSHGSTSNIDTDVSQGVFESVSEQDGCVNSR
jgi:hypothetical protein